MKLWDAACKFMEKKSFALFPCILPSFSQNESRLLLPKRLWKCTSTISFRNYKRKEVLLIIYLSIMIHLSELSSCGIWHWRCLEYGFCQINKLEFFVSCNTSLFNAESKRKALWEYPSFCAKNVSSNERVKPCFFCDF